MRTQFLKVGLLVTLAGGLVSAGCDDVHTGQPSDPAGPVRLVRALVQDSEQPGLTGVMVDLLDNPGTPLSTAFACNPNLTPCQTQYSLAFVGQDWSCLGPDGMPVAPGETACDAGGCSCNDPIAPTGTVTIPIVSSNPPAPGAYAGTQIRLVFNKQLNADEIEHADNNADAGFTLNDGVVDLTDAAGAKVAVAAYWDGAGSPSQTSDVIFVPFGPAITLKPLQPIAANTTYHIVVHSGAIHDRNGNPMADQNGAPVSGDVKIDFTTEAGAIAGITPNIDVTPAPTADPPVAAPILAQDQVVQFQFNTPVDPATFKFNVTAVDAGGAAITLPTFKAYYDQGNPDDGCYQLTNLIDLTPVDGTGAPTSWPVGTYTLQRTPVGAPTTPGWTVQPVGDADPAHAISRPKPPAAGKPETVYTFVVQAPPAAGSTTGKALSKDQKNHPMTCTPAAQ